MMAAEIQALCDAMNGAVVAVDSSGRVVAANDEARGRQPVLNGRSATARAGDDAISVEAVFGPKLADAAARALALSRAGGDARAAGLDGQVAVLQCGEKPVALVMDRLQDSRARRARDASLDALAMLAHDLRGALGNVCGAFALLDEDLAEDAEHGPRIAAMRGALAHFSDLIEAALDLESLSAGQISVKPRDVELRQFVDEVTAIWEPRLAEIGVTLHTQVNVRAPEKIRVDPMRLKQVIFNLLGNAEAHAQAQNVKISVNEIERGEGEKARFAIVVEDDGVGLPDHVLARMRESSAHSLFGEGRRRLGLSVVQDIANSMGGAVSCANSADGGARIRLVAPTGMDAPIMGPRVVAIPKPAEHEPAPATAPGGGLVKAVGQGGVRGLKALLAEDNATNQLVATQMLDKLGCEVEVASDGVEAVEMLRKGSYDFLLVDIEMPKMSGIDVLRRLRGGEAGPSHLPAIALTAYAMAEHRRKVADAGADGMIAKPILGVKSFETDLVEILGRVIKSRGVGQSASPAGRRTGDAPASLPDPDIDMGVFDGLIAVIGADSSDEFLERVEADLADVRLRIRNGAKAGDLSEIRAGAHILISVAGAIGARTLQTIAEGLHARAAAGDIEGARVMVKEGDPEFMAVAAFIYRRRAGAPRKDS